jgi:hypothetical protein
MKIKENKIIKEALVLDTYAVVKELLPDNLFKSNDPKLKEKAKKVVEDLINTLNDFYDDHDINWKVKTTKRAFENRKLK